MLNQTLHASSEETTGHFMRQIGAHSGKVVRFLSLALGTPLAELNDVGVLRLFKNDGLVPRTVNKRRSILPHGAAGVLQS
jgi:hypothetical protein